MTTQHAAEGPSVGVRPSSITCLGDSLIDFLPTGEGEETTAFQMAVGGAMLNVAVGLARLQQPVAYVGKIADDFFGHRLRAAIAREGINDRFVVGMHGHTTLAFAAFEAGEPVFTFYGEGTADTMLRADELPSAFFEQTRLLLTGSTSLLRGEMPATVRTVLQQLQGQSLLVLDPNIRPSLIVDAAEYRALLDELFGLCDVVKVSAADLTWLAPGETSEALAERILRCGVELVLVTRGGAGALAVSRRGARVEVPAWPVTIRDTVGAGDAFSAAALCWLSEGELMTRADIATLDETQLGDLLRWASAAAADTCTRVGANPPTRAELERMLARTADA
jgi:fructokinase